MNPQATKQHFFEFASQWLCDSYSLGINYLATPDQDRLKIISAALFVYPLPLEHSSNFAIEAGNLLAGQEIFPSLTKADILQRLEKAAVGELEVNGLQLHLEAATSLDYYSEVPHPDTWFSDIHLQISGSKLTPAPLLDSIFNDNELRRANPPFDGIEDLCSWLQLTDVRIIGREPTISLRISPPVDIIFDESEVRANSVQLTLSAHPKFDTSKIGLAIKEYPGNGIATRKQTSTLISWKRAKNGRRPGVLKMPLTKADSVLAMLTVCGRTVRRQWFLDPDKAVNARYVATQLFDKDLSKLKQAVLEATDSVRFEQGVASLLFLLGFATAIQVETQAPDILAATPGGKLAIIECTTKISDFQSKLGKLVERRNGLLKSLEATGHALRVDAFLVCGLPKAQIAVEDRLLAQHQVTLLCKEDITQAFTQLRIPANPDEMLDRAAAQLNQARSPLG